MKALRLLMLGAVRGHLMPYNRTVEQDPGDASAARDSDLARRERQTPAIRLGLFLLLGLVAGAALLSPTAPAAAARGILLRQEGGRPC